MPQKTAADQDLLCLQVFQQFWFKKDSGQFLAKECAQLLVNRLED